MDAAIPALKLRTSVLMAIAFSRPLPSQHQSSSALREEAAPGL